MKRYARVDLTNGHVVGHGACQDALLENHADLEDDVCVVETTATGGRFIDLVVDPAYPSGKVYTGTSAGLKGASYAFSATTVVADGSTAITVSNLAVGDTIIIRHGNKATNILAAETTQDLAFATAGTYYVDILPVDPTDESLLGTEVTAT